MNSIARVHYYQRQYLRTEDFTDEQAYHLAMRRRHNIAHHTWGIVTGLDLSVDPDHGLAVQPGMAIDGYGRELVVPDRRPIPTAAFDEKNSDILDVWLLYSRSGSDDPPPGYIVCATDEAGSGDTFYRWQENPVIYLSEPDPARPDRRKPASVPQADLDFGSWRTPPDDPQQDWPVFLGQIRRSRERPADPFIYEAIHLNRPYVGLVGETISAPSGRARVEVGTEQPNSTRRFAVFVADQGPVNPQVDPALEIAQDGAIDLRADVALHGNLTLPRGTIEFGVGRATRPGAQTPQDAPAPWSIYRQQTGSVNAPAHELRVEMAPGTGQGTNQVVIGTWSEDDKAFRPCLTIKDNCRIVVHGNLVVEGQIIETKPRPIPAFTPQARQLMTASGMVGQGGAGTLLDQFYESDALAQINFIKGIVASPSGYQSAAVAISNLGIETQLAQALHQRSVESAQALRDALDAILSGGRGGNG